MVQKSQESWVRVSAIFSKLAGNVRFLWPPCLQARLGVYNEPKNIENRGIFAFLETMIGKWFLHGVWSQFGGYFLIL